MNNLCKKTMIITALTATATLSSLPAQAVSSTTPTTTQINNSTSASVSSKLTYAKKRYAEVMKKVNEMKTLRTIWIKKTDNAKLALESKKSELAKAIKDYNTTPDIILSEEAKKNIEQLQNDIIKLKKIYQDTSRIKDTVIKRTQGWIVYASKWATIVKNETIKVNIFRQWGVYPLPVSLGTIKAYHLTKNDVINIANSSAWANTPHARAVVQCESGGDYSINTGNGYYGAWQFDYGSWLSNGGGRFAETANGAPKWAQDLVAYTYWSSSGWGPWACA